MDRAPVVVGIAEHNGWAIFVCVGAQNGSPAVVDRRRVELVESGLPNQPYEHETVEMNTLDAERLVQEVRESAVRCAERALTRLGVSPVSIALRTPPLAQRPGSVAEVHASWHLRARADAMLFHDALCTAAVSLGIKVAMIKREDEGPRAAEAMATTVKSLEGFLSGFRESLGPPWQKDHQAAAARAIAALGHYTTLRLPKSRKPRS